MPIASRTVNCQLSTVNCKVKQGFTLIEVMIVVALLGLLAGIISPAYIASQQKARDGVRKSDLAQIKRALEVAKQDCKGSAWYPVMTDADEKAWFTALRSHLSDSDLKYMSSVPQDPKNSGEYVYRYNTTTGTASMCLDSSTPPTLAINGSTDFMLRALLERSDDPDISKTWNKCTGKPGVPTGSANGYYYVCND